MGIIKNNRLLADELIRYSRLCYERHLVGASGGNLSVRISGKDIFLATASGVSLRDVTLENIVSVDSNGNIIDGQAGLKPSKEISFHLAIYNAKPDVNAVIHVHPTFVTVYTIAKKQIPLETVSAKLKLKQSKVVSEASPGSMELCNNIVKTLKEVSDDTTILLLERHGLVAYHKTLCDAFNDAELTEDTAKISFFVSR